MLAHDLKTAFHHGHLVRFKVAAEFAARSSGFGPVGGNLAALGAGHHVFDLGIGVLATQVGPLLFGLLGGHAHDFAEFIAHQESAHRYLTLGREEVREACARNHARQIGTTPYWAVLAIDDGARARFVRRLLEFVGCQDETVRLALRALGLAVSGPRAWPDRHVA